MNNARVEKQKRLVGAPRASLLEREEMRQKKIRIKDKFELNNLGGFERIYPLHPDELADNPKNQALQNKYDALVEASKDVYNEGLLVGVAKKPTNFDKVLSGPNQGGKVSPEKEKTNSVKKDGAKKLIKLNSAMNNQSHSQFAQKQKASNRNQTIEFPPASREGNDLIAESEM